MAGMIKVILVGRQAFAAIVKDGARQPWIFTSIYVSTNATEKGIVAHTYWACG